MDGDADDPQWVEGRHLAEVCFGQNAPTAQAPVRTSTRVRTLDSVVAEASVQLRKSLFQDGNIFRIRRLELS